MTLSRRQRIGAWGLVVSTDDLAPGIGQETNQTAEDLQGEFYAAYRSGAPEALSLGERLLEHYPELRSIWSKVVHLRLGGGEPGRALELAEAGLQRFAEDSELLRLCASAAEHLNGETAALPWLERWAATGKDGGFGHYRLGDYYMNLGEGRRAVHHFMQAKDAGCPSPQLASRYFHSALLARDPLLARNLLPLLSSEETIEAEREIRALETRGGELEKARRAGRLRSLSSVQLKAWAKSRGLQPGRHGKSDLFMTEHGDLLAERMPGSRAAVLVFGGLKEMMGASLPKFDKTLRAHGVSTLYLTDPRRMLMLAGIPSFGSHDETIAGLGALLEAWGVDRIYCMGLSAGGYGAILYGLDLGARRILTMAAPTTLTGPVIEADGRGRIIVSRIQSEVSGELDLRKRLETASRPPPIINYYGLDSPPDVRHALHLEGLPNVSLRAVDGVVGHDVLGALRARGQAPAVLAEFLADAGC